MWRFCIGRFLKGTCWEGGILARGAFVALRVILLRIQFFCLEIHDCLHLQSSATICYAATTAAFVISVSNSIRYL